ncbi:MAG: GNAT family N-acetyltransferase [Candidatus Methylomirabilales bacterium]
MASEIVVRDARQEDNDALIVLDRQCVMGGAIPLVFDRSPDFFARSRAYDSFRLCVAEEGGTIIGVGGVTVKSLQVNGIRDRWGYFYDLRVKPTHQRRGVARRIANVLRDTVLEAGIVGAYSWVIEGNTPSESFVEGRGNIPLRQCAMALISGSDGGESRGFERITERDDEVASLLDATYRLHDFTPPWDPATLYRTLDRLAPLGWQGLYCRQVHGTWAACFGLWDYSQVMQLSFRGRPSEKPFRPFFLYPLGWRDPDTLVEGLRAARAMITASGGTLLLPYVPGDLLGDVIPPDAVRIGLTLYVRAPWQGRKQKDRLVFIDPTDL